MRVVFLLVLLFASRLAGLSQIVPSLADSVLVCHPGAYPYYISVEDSSCLERYYYPSGALMAAGTCKNGVKAGKWTSFFESGDTMSSGEIHDGRLVGHWIFNHKNGKPKAKGNFVGGKFEIGSAGSGSFDSVTIMSGVWNFWNINGVNTIQCQFRKNEYGEESINGPFLKRYDDGQKMESGLYRNGMKNAVWSYWYANGQLKKQEQYSYEDCDIYDYVWYECPKGEWKYWLEDGTLDKIEVYQNGRLVRTVKK